MINLELYRAFYAVAQTGSLTAAAKELYVSQPALSQSILHLEQQLGGQLFVRTSKGMVLTPEGSEIFDYVEQALGMFSAAENSFNEMKNLVSGCIRIGASDTLCRHFLLNYITKFHKLYPHINIEVTNRTSPETITLLRTGKVDVAFVNLPIDEQNYEIKECMELNDCFVGDKKTYQSITNPLSAQELVKYPLIMIETSSNTRQNLDKHMESLGVNVRPEIELGSFDLVVEFSKAGLGIGFVTREFVKKELERGELFEIPTTFSMPKRAIGSITKKDVPQTFAASRFMKIVTEK